MLKWLFPFIVLAGIASCSQHITPQAAKGTLEHLQDFESKYIDE